jgi:hypothetical protein
VIAFPPEFTPLFRQLIEPPELSSALLAGAAAGAPLAAQPDWAMFPIASSRAAIAAILSDQAAVPPSALSLPFREEEGRFDVRFDVIRVRYRAGDLLLDVAQSKHVISVRAAGGAGADPEALAARLLRAPTTVHLQSPRNVGGFEFGGRDTAYGLVSPDWPHWFDALLWWRWQKEIGFVTLKATGGPTREPITADDEDNERWFG